MPVLEHHLEQGDELESKRPALQHFAFKPNRQVYDAAQNESTVGRRVLE